MTTELVMPSASLAAKVRSDLAVDEWLVGVRMHRMGGSGARYIYSFGEAARFLHMDSDEDLNRPRSGAYVGYIDPEVLKRWIVGVFGDTELVAAIEADTQGLSVFAQVVDPIHRLLELRLEQCSGLDSHESGASAVPAAL